MARPLQAKAPAPSPAVGDWVQFDPSTGLIKEVFPRKPCLVRKKAGRATEHQVIAANVDVMFIVMSLDNDYSIRRLERWLIVAEDSGANPVIVLNKSDVCDDLVPKLNEIDKITQAPVVVMSAVDGSTVTQLSRHI